MSVRRRTLLASGLAVAGGTAFVEPAPAQAATQPAGPAAASPTGLPETAGGSPVVPLRWLDGEPAATAGSAFGVPWPRGTLARHDQVALATSDGTAVPVQSWPLAYWPDGTVKWSGHAVDSTVPFSDGYTLTKGTPARPATAVTAKRDKDQIVLSNGTVTVRLATHGTAPIASITRGSRLTGHDGQLTLLLRDAPENATHTTTYLGVVEKADIEQTGPVRAVVRLAGGYHRDNRRILPWTLRVYLGAGDDSIRLVHSFTWDADTAHDFIKGLGLQVSVPMNDEAHNRHIRFGTVNGGVWGEPVRVLTGLRRDPGAAVRAAQIAGTATPPVDQWATTVSSEYTQLALWNDFALVQNSSEHAEIWKRTTSAGSWLKHAGHAQRATGFAYVGGISGGLGAGLRDFWQRFPRGIDIAAAAGDTATITLWSWSPHADVMDLRHYDTVAHGLDLSYEDVQAGFSTPEGMVRSTDMRLWAYDSTPSRDSIAALAPTLLAPPQIVATPEWYHGAGVFGRWALPDRSTAARAALENGVAQDIAFYAGEVEDRQWYGFWHYGDVMHTYDADRHSWRYDVGGYAWDNGELGSDAMLWYAFLRTGTPAVFRLAHAMTQHVSEVDTHHSGRFAGLGSRHNVSHWGDGAKEARVGESFTKRFSYYLTADELLGELIRTTLRADKTLLTVEPLREVLPPQTIAPTRLRIGPDWYALVSNWMTEWERTGDTRWRDRIVVGMKDIATFPAGLFTGEAGGVVGFDPATGHLTNLDKGDYTGGYNLAMAFGGDQILWEAMDLVDVPEFRAVVLDFARYVQAPSAEKIARYGFDFNPQVFKTIYSRMTAWAGEQMADPTIQTRGWQQFTTDPAGIPWPASVVVTGDPVAVPVREIPGKGDFGTNDAAQRGLALVALLAVAPAEAP